MSQKKVRSRWTALALLSRHGASNVAGFAIIPYTYGHTNLRDAKIGDAVNLEADIFAKYVERVLDARRTPGAPRPSFAELLKEGL